MVTTRDPAPDEWDADFASDSDSRPLVLAAASHSPDRTREGPSPTWRQRYPHDRSSSDSSWPSSFFSSLPRSEGAADEQQDCSLSQGSSSPRHLGPLSAGAGVQERSLALPRISTKVDGAQHRAPAFGSSSHRTHSRPPTHPASASSLDLAAGTRLGSVHTASASSSVGQRSGTGSVLEPDTGVRPDRGLPSPSLPLSPMQISQPFESSPLPTSFTLSSQHCTPGISEKSSGPRISLSGRSLPSRSRPASPTSSQHISRQRPSSELHIPAHIRAAQARIRNDNYLVKQFAAGILELNRLYEQRTKLATLLPCAPDDVPGGPSDAEGWWECAAVLLTMANGTTEPPDSPKSSGADAFTSQFSLPPIQLSHRQLNGEDKDQSIPETTISQTCSSIFLPQAPVQQPAPSTVDYTYEANPFPPDTSVTSGNNSPKYVGASLPRDIPNDHSVATLTLERRGMRPQTLSESSSGCNSGSTSEVQTLMHENSLDRPTQPRLSVSKCSSCKRAATDKVDLMRPNTVPFQLGSMAEKETRPTSVPERQGKVNSSTGGCGPNADQNATNRSSHLGRARPRSTEIRTRPPPIRTRTTTTPSTSLTNEKTRAILAALLSGVHPNPYGPPPSSHAASPSQSPYGAPPPPPASVEASSHRSTFSSSTARLSLGLAERQPMGRPYLNARTGTYPWPSSQPLFDPKGVKADTSQKLAFSLGSGPNGRNGASGSGIPDDVAPGHEPYDRHFGPDPPSTRYGFHESDHQHTQRERRRTSVSTPFISAWNALKTFSAPAGARRPSLLSPLANWKASHPDLNLYESVTPQQASESQPSRKTWPWPWQNPEVGATSRGKEEEGVTRPSAAKVGRKRAPSDITGWHSRTNSLASRSTRVSPSGTSPTQRFVPAAIAFGTSAATGSTSLTSKSVPSLVAQAGDHGLNAPPSASLSRATAMETRGKLGPQPPSSPSLKRPIRQSSGLPPWTPPWYSPRSHRKDAQDDETLNASVGSQRRGSGLRTLAHCQTPKHVKKKASVNLLSLPTTSFGSGPLPSEEESADLRHSLGPMGDSIPAFNPSQGGDANFSGFSDQTVPVSGHERTKSDASRIGRAPGESPFSSSAVPLSEEDLFALLNQASQGTSGSPRHLQEANFPAGNTQDPGSKMSSFATASSHLDGMDKGRLGKGRNHWPRPSSFISSRQRLLSSSAMSNSSNRSSACSNTQEQNTKLMSSLRLGLGNWRHPSSGKQDECVHDRTPTKPSRHPIALTPSRSSLHHAEAIFAGSRRSTSIASAEGSACELGTGDREKTAALEGSVSNFMGARANLRRSQRASKASKSMSSTVAPSQAHPSSFALSPASIAEAKEKENTTPRAKSSDLRTTFDSLSSSFFHSPQLPSLNSLQFNAPKQSPSRMRPRSHTHTSSFYPGNTKNNNISNKLPGSHPIARVIAHSNVNKATNYTNTYHHHRNSRSDGNSRHGSRNFHDDPVPSEGSLALDQPGAVRHRLLALVHAIASGHTHAAPASTASSHHSSLARTLSRMTKFNGSSPRFRHRSFSFRRSSTSTSTSPSPSVPVSASCYRPILNTCHARSGLDGDNSISIRSHTPAMLPTPEEESSHEWKGSVRTTNTTASTMSVASTPSMQPGPDDSPEVQKVVRGEDIARHRPPSSWSRAILGATTMQRSVSTPASGHVSGSENTGLNKQRTGVSDAWQKLFLASPSSACSPENGDSSSLQPTSSAHFPSKPRVASSPVTKHLAPDSDEPSLSAPEKGAKQIPAKVRSPLALMNPSWMGSKSNGGVPSPATGDLSSSVCASAPQQQQQQQQQRKMTAPNHTSSLGLALLPQAFPALINYLDATCARCEESVQALERYALAHGVALPSPTVPSDPRAVTVPSDPRAAGLHRVLA